MMTEQKDSECNSGALSRMEWGCQTALQISGLLDFILNFLKSDN